MDALLYTDGACSPNPGIGGWAAILVAGERELELSGAEVETTNNRQELLAVLNGLRALKRPCRVTVVSDSDYVISPFTKGWLLKWKRAGWKRKKVPIKNPDLWQQLDAEVAKHEVRWEWVRGHDGHPYNERCDRLAVAAAAALRRSLFE